MLCVISPAKRLDAKPRVLPGAPEETRPAFADRARENIHLAISDDVDLSGRDSHDNMFREWHFFPRHQ